MRSAQKNNRTRGRGNRKSNGNSLNRVYDSSGPEGKVRGTPQQIIEKYLSLARDAQTAGDRVTGENFLQHAEHYQRIVIQATAAQNERREGQESESTADDSAAAPSGESGAADGGPERQRRREQMNGQGDEGQRERAAGRKETEPTPPAAEGVVSGLTTIDPEGDDGSSLLVATEDVGASQPAPSPPRRRRSRAPKPEPAADAEPKAAEPTSDPA